ncbi:MAG: type II toxin-antitoxin system RelE/ParE family toxin [Nitrospira sp.]|nr:type II toxin-antitoxin system RelE/ParE family toxin [Nitrospira sp.]
MEEFLNDLPKHERAEVGAILEDLKDHGLAAPLVSMRQIQGKLWEVRISRTRIFYVMLGSNTMVLLHAYKKQSQKAPRHEIETALRRMRDLLE